VTCSRHDIDGTNAHLALTLTHSNYNVRNSDYEMQKNIFLLCYRIMMGYLT